MNTENNSIEVQADEEGTIAAAYQEYLDETGNEDDGQWKEIFYAGAQAVLNCATPLSKMSVLRQEIDDFFDAQ